MTLATCGTVGYDYLVYAVGSGSADPQVPGAAESPANGRPGGGAAGSAGRRRRARNGRGDRRRSRCETGIETAAELAEGGRTVTLVCGGVLGPSLHPRGRRSVTRRLAVLGVTVLEGPDTKVTAVTRDAGTAE